MPPPERVTIVGGPFGEWQVLEQRTVVGAPLPGVAHLSRQEGPDGPQGPAPLAARGETLRRGVSRGADQVSTPGVETGASSPGFHLGLLEGADFVLRGVRSNERYLERHERERLLPVQPALGRPGCNRAALIPIRKRDEWWSLAQDERRAIFEASSRHIAIGFEYMPAIARRLYHARDLGEPFDFLTWFEYEPDQGDRFEELVQRLRETEEWRFVDREIDFRLTRQVSW